MDIQLFNFGTETTRVVLDEAGEPWWVLSEVARLLKYRDAANAGRLLREKHKGTRLVSTLGGQQEVTVISEAGLYRLMMRSDRPEAEPFQDWITDEVIPQIRKTGKYAIPTPLPPRLKIESFIGYVEPNLCSDGSFSYYNIHYPAYKWKNERGMRVSLAADGVWLESRGFMKSVMGFGKWQDDHAEEILGVAQDRRQLWRNLYQRIAEVGQAGVKDVNPVGGYAIKFSCPLGIEHHETHIHKDLAMQFKRFLKTEEEQQEFQDFMDFGLDRELQINDAKAVYEYLTRDRPLVLPPTSRMLKDWQDKIEWGERLYENLCLSQKIRQGLVDPNTLTLPYIRKHAKALEQPKKERAQLTPSDQ